MFQVVGTAPNAQEIFTDVVDLGRDRTLYQDPSFGIRQLVDTATQALSPAVNSTTTAVQALDRLFDVVGRIGRMPSPTGLVADAEGTVRFVYPVLTWPDVVELAFVEIRQFGGGATQITRAAPGLGSLTSWWRSGPPSHLGESGTWQRPHS